jgi:hypothetical protein
MNDPTLQQAKKYLLNLYQNYQIDLTGNVRKSYKIKCLASMEMLLVLLGVLGAGQPLNRPMITKTFRLFWVFPIAYTRKERYEDFIQRKAYETLNSY